ncbi:MAG: fibrobacter succinogenes major paralogous domain-containing protein [Alistipes sp.]|nr:fibrobacter succinogenes major paralogous domain-containing protein [Alistipes sp.]
MLQSPAAGYRNRETGALGGIGTEGNVWSSSSYAAGNINAGRLNFNSGNVNPLNTGNRANGFSVRCVQHLQGCFLSFFGCGAKKSGGGTFLNRNTYLCYKCRCTEF